MAPLLVLCLLLGARPVSSLGGFIASPAASVVAPEALPVEVVVGACPPADEGTGRWVFLSDLPWTTAATGWQAIADVVLPERDVSFSRNPLVMGGVPYEKGLGTYPLSEVTYDLGGRYGALRAQLGLNDDSATGTVAVFLVYADGVLVHNSGPIGAGEAARALELCVAGVRELRLVTARQGQQTPDIPGFASGGEGAEVGGYANWAAARVFLPSNAGAAAAQGAQPALSERSVARRAQQVGELGAYREVGSGWMESLRGRFGVAAAETWPRQTQAFQEADGRLVLAHRRMAVRLGYGETQHAALSVLDVRTGMPVFTGAGSAIETATGVIDLARDTVPVGPDGFSFARVEDAALGSGTELRARLRTRATPLAETEAAAPVMPVDTPTETNQRIEIRVTLFDDRPYFTYQVTLEGWEPSEAPRRLDYLGAGSASFVAGTGGRYFADASYARSGPLTDDGLWRTARVGIVKPAVVWGEASAGSTVLTVLDERRLPAWLVSRREWGRAAAVVGISQPLETAPADGQLAGPRLLIEQSAATDLMGALSTYRRVSEALYPAAPLPEWVRYQWGSWYVYGDHLEEARLRRQIDLIALYLSDLGTWHIVIDAGWQDIGRGGSGDLGRANSAKFPSGLRSLVDYAHARGVKVMLYLAPTYVHDGAVQGEWLALHGLLQTHPEWFVRVSPEGAQSGRYLFDFANPEARAYLSDVVGRFVTEHGADGISLDGLGDVEGQLIPMSERLGHLPDRWRLTPVMDAYRLVAEALWARKPDAFIESGWVSPAPAQRYAHTFRFADDKDVFDYGYPHPGLLQHFDYAMVQRALGQRAQVGAIQGGFNRPIMDQWLGMAMATGGHVSMASDFTFVRSEGFEALRAQLVHYRPLAGETRAGTECNGLCPSWSATSVGELTFVGLMNREAAPRRVEVRLADLPGAEAGTGGSVFAYDVAARRPVGVGEVLAAEVPARSFRLIVVRRTPGVFWTTSSYETEATAGGWRLRVRGPADVEGHMRFYLPGGPPRQVRLDGRALGVPSSNSWEGASYDAAARVLSIQYVHETRGSTASGMPPPRTIEILR